MESDILEIRTFDMEDRNLVEEFFDQMGSETRAFFDRGSVNRKNALSFFEGKDRNILRWIAMDHGRMVGYVFLWDLDTTIPWLGIAVSDDYKGKHLGRKLMKTAEEYAQSQNNGGILLTTHIANLRGQALYEHCGYERMGIHNTGEILYLLRFNHKKTKS